MALSTDAPDYWQYIDYIRLIGTINVINTIAAITNIVNVQSVDLIDLITRIDEITEIVQITNIRDLALAPKSFFVNPDFEQDFVGWYTTGTVIIDDTDGYYSQKCLNFLSGFAGNAAQSFHIPLGVDWLTRLYCFVKSPNTGVNVVRIYYDYTDGTGTDEYLQVAAANVWERKTLSPSAGKYIETMRIAHLPLTYTVRVDGIRTVF